MRAPAQLRNSSKALVGEKSRSPAYIINTSLAILALLLLLISPAKANEQTLTYEVYAGGIHAVQATLLIKTDKNNQYDLILDAKTRGFLGKLVPWEGTFESHGRIEDKTAFKPDMHKSTTGWEEDIDIKEYLYNRDGTFKSLKITDEYSKNEKRDVSQELTDHTIDALTATLQVLNDYYETNKCEGSAEVFDGKRRFEQKFKHVKNTTLESSTYNIYAGDAAECTVEVTPVAGEWHKKPRGWMSIQEQGRERGTMPTVWLGKIAKNAPAIPVKIRVKTAYGTLFMHLAEYQNEGQIIVAEKRVTEAD